MHDVERELKVAFQESVQRVIAEEASTASELRDVAEMHRSVGNSRQQKVYERAAAKADKRASAFRKLLK